jgi:hypothetical protein
MRDDSFKNLLKSPGYSHIFFLQSTKDPPDNISNFIQFDI